MAGISKKPLPLAFKPDFARSTFTGAGADREKREEPRPAFQSPGSHSVSGRLRRVKPHELALFCAGLGLLVIVPLVQLLSSSPDSATPRPFGFAGPADPLFGGGADPHEEGILGIAQGGVIGGDRNLVTPNSSGDPLRLIKRDQEEAQKPAAEQARPAEPEPKREAPSASDWKSVLSSARGAVKAAADKAPGLPRPGGKLTSALQGLAALSGGGGSPSTAANSPRLEPLSSKGLVDAPRQVSSLHAIQSVSGYKGAAARGLTAGSGSGSPGAMHPLSEMAGANGYLQDVSFAGMSHGAGGGALVSGGGRPSNGEATAFPSGGGGLKDQRTITPGNKGEDLTALRKKLEMQKAIDLKWDKKNYEELGRKKMMEQILVQTLAQTAQQAFLKVLDKLLNPQGNGQGAGGEE